MDEEKNKNNPDSEKRITSCRRCGMILVNSKFDLCSKCIKKLEFIFLKAKRFLRSNPGATVEQIAKNSNTTVETIKEFIDSGKFARSGIRKIAHECRLCRKIIYEGLMCPNCEQTLKEQLASLLQETNEKNKKN